MIVAATGAEAATQPKVMNPPMIHSLAVPPTSSDAQLVAAACGDGTIVVWDMDKVCTARLPITNAHSS